MTILSSTNQGKDEKHSEDYEGMQAIQLFHIMETHAHNRIWGSIVKTAMVIGKAGNTQF